MIAFFAVVSLLSLLCLSKFPPQLPDLLQPRRRAAAAVTSLPLRLPSFVFCVGPLLPKPHIFLLPDVLLHFGGEQSPFVP